MNHDEGYGGLASMTAPLPAEKRVAKSPKGTPKEMKMKRKIHGIMHDGKRVFLGKTEMTAKEAKVFLDGVAQMWAANDNGWINVGSSLYLLQVFVGIQINPPVSDEELATKRGADE